VKFTVRTGKITVTARSSLHDTRTVWDRVTGEVEADPGAIEAAKASFTVDMTTFDAGDWLKNRKLRKDFDLETHPRATFQLSKVSEVVRDGASFTAKAEGILAWHGKQVVLELAGRGTLDNEHVVADATFPLDIRKLGLSAPRFFVFKMEDEVTVSVSVTGAPA
jgi:polyisoprenoid-binding protein YceI